MCSETSTAQHIIYNIKTGLFGTRVVLRKRLDSRALEFLFPSPAPPKKKHPQPTQKCLPIKFPITSAPRDRFHGQSPSANPSASDPCKGLPPKTRKRTRAGSIRNAHLKPSYHRTGRTTVVRPAQPGRVPAQWARAIRPPAPVRGLSRPSTPPPLHWREETCSQTFFPRAVEFFIPNEPQLIINNTQPSLDNPDRNP